MKKLFIAVFILTLSFLSFSQSIPAPKEEFLFKVEDVYSMGMGNSAVALPNKFGIITNPASLGLLKEKHLNITYELTDYNNLLEKNTVNDKNNISSIFLITNLGGLYFRNIGDGKEKYVQGNTNHKYNLDLKELGISIVNKSDNIEGFFTGLNLKLYAGHIMEILADNNNKLLDSHLDRGIGAGIDLGFLLKKNYVTLGFAWNDLFSRVWWGEYNHTTINGSLNCGLGIDLNFIKYGLSAKKVLLPEYPFEFGSGIEFVVISLPEEYSFNFLKEARVKLRSGVYGENIFEDKKKYHYGIELANKKNYIDLATISDKINLFENMEKNVYKMSIGLKF